MIHVVAGVIERGDDVLVCKRRLDKPHPGRWEFPGGKVEPGERPEQALRRELAEELAIEAEIGELLYETEHRYAGGPPLRLSFFRIRRHRGEIATDEFAEVRWQPRAVLGELDFLEADLGFVATLRREDTAEPPSLRRFDARSALWIFGLALALRLGFLVSSAGGPLGNPDTRAYEQLAHDMVAHRSYRTSDPGGPGGFPGDLQRPPGYPLFLALLEASTGSTRSRVKVAVVQSVLASVFAAGLCIGVGALANPRVGRSAGIWFATDWTSIVHTPVSIAETVYAVVLGSSLLVLAADLTSGEKASREASPYRSLLGGGLLGFAALVKPAALLVVPFPVVIALVRRRFAAALLVAASFAAFTIPWMIRNQIRYGVFTLSEIPISALYFYTAAGAEAGFDPQASNFGAQRIEQIVNDLDAQWSSRALSPRERSEGMRAEAWSILVRHPLAAVMNASLGLVRTSFGTAHDTVAALVAADPSPRTALETPIVRILPLIQVLLFWWFVARGAARLVGSRGDDATISLLFACAASAILACAASPLGYARFRVPAVPALAWFAGWGLAATREDQFRCNDSADTGGK